MGDEVELQGSSHGLLSESKSRIRKHQQFAAAIYGRTESHQYEADENEVWRHHQLQRHFEDKGRWWTFSKTREVRRWGLTFLTGFWIGAVALFVAYFTKLLTGYKFDTFNWLIEQEKAGEYAYGSAFLFLTVYNIVLAIGAYFSVVLEPLAGGSGIPEVKCFLNGLNIPRLVKMKTLVCKAVGIVLSCSAGLPLGKEGPMIHIGAVVGSIISQGKSTGTAMAFDSTFTKNQDFRNDKEKRDFVACGAGAGVAAAFGAPIGGVLFSLEEGASFWTVKLIWRCFFCCLTTVASIYLILSMPSMFSHSESGAMFSFGEFFSLQGEKSNYSLWEFSMFLVVGILGGLIGATFNYLNGKVNLFRRTTSLRSVASFKLLEVLLITVVMSLITCLLPYLWTKCTPLPVDMKGWSEQEKTLVMELNPLYCNADTEYNELASLWLTDSDGAIKQLFHFREIGDHKVSTFSSAGLFLFAVPYVLMACVTAGSAVPAGLFVPSLLSGAAFGRLVGHLLHKADQTRGTFADSGTYALMGSAAVTGGVTRITISLTLMILEATGDMQYVLPLMLTVMAASMVGNVFTKSIYEQHIESRRLHHLDEEENVSNLVYFYDWTVSNVMTPHPVCVRPVARVGELYETLQKVQHHCFPVVTVEEGRGGKQQRHVLCGTITRKVICTLMKHKAFAPPSADPTSAERLSPLVNWGVLESIYPYYPDVADFNISETEAQCWLDLRPYVDAAAFCINEQATIQRAYRMFRTLGLRHLCVVDHSNEVQGILTRADLADLANEAEELEEEQEELHAAGDWAGGAGADAPGTGIKRRRGRGGHALQHTIAPDVDLEGNGLPPSPMAAKPSTRK